MKYKTVPFLVLIFMLSGCGTSTLDPSTETTANESSSRHASQSLAEKNAVREVGGSVISGRTQLMTLKAAGAYAPAPLTPSDLCYVVFIDLTSGQSGSISGGATSQPSYMYARLVMDASDGLMLSYVKSKNPW